MLEKLILNYKPIMKIFLYSLIFIIIGIGLSYKIMQEHVKDNWQFYRSNPLVMPFAGILYQPTDMSAWEFTKENFMNVIWTAVQKFLNILLSPVYSILEMFIKMLKSYSLVLDKIRSQMAVMRNFLFKIFEGMFKRLQESAAALTFYFLKMREQMKRSYGLLNLLMSSVEHSYIFMESLVNGPVGMVGKFAEGFGVAMSIFTFGAAGVPVWRNSLCFHPLTPIEMNDGTFKTIDDVQTGELLKNNNMVIAAIAAEVSTPMYRVNNVIVSGDHLLLFEEEWIRAKNHPFAELVDYDAEFVVCLITSTGEICINGLRFKDYLDTHCRFTYRKIRNVIENNLNHIDEIIDYKGRVEGKTWFPYNSCNCCSDLFTGIDPNIPVDGRDIVGKVDIMKNTLNIFNVEGRHLSGNVLILYNGKWIRVFDHPEAIYVGLNKKQLIHYITRDGNIRLDNGILIRDFTEIKDKEVSLLLDNIVDKTL